MDTTRKTSIPDLIWRIAERLRGDYKPHEYADVILPFVVLRRLDAAMEPSRAAVQAIYERYVGKLNNLDNLLSSTAAANNKEASPVYNTSPFSWQRLLDVPDDIDKNLIAYLNGFSTDVKDIIERFEFRRQIG